MTIAADHPYLLHNPSALIPGFSPNSSPEMLQYTSGYGDLLDGDDDDSKDLFDFGGSMEEDSVPSQAGAMGKPKKSNGRKGNLPGAADKRATHNAIERARRESLNGRFMTLAEALPSMANVKRPSKSIIVNKALDFVFDAQVKEHALIKENNELRLQVDQLRARLGMPLLPPPAPLIDENSASHKANKKKLAAAAAASAAAHASPSSATSTSPQTSSMPAAAAPIPSTAAFTGAQGASPTFSSPSPAGSMVSAAGASSGNMSATLAPQALPVAIPQSLYASPSDSSFSPTSLTASSGPADSESLVSSLGANGSLPQQHAGLQQPSQMPHHLQAPHFFHPQSGHPPQHTPFSHQTQQQQQQFALFAAQAQAQAQAAAQAQQQSPYGFLNPQQLMSQQQQQMLFAAHLQQQSMGSGMGLEGYTGWTGAMGTPGAATQGYNPLEPFPFSLS